MPKRLVVIGSPDIRPATPEDAVGMAAVLNSIIERGGTTAHEDPVSAAEMRARIAGLGPRGAAHVAEDDGRIVGFQFVERDERLPGDVGAMATFTAVDAAGRGIGQALFNATLRAARAAGYRALNATIRADNAVGLRFYTMMGFEDHSVEDAVPLKDGAPVDWISKRRAL